jgi:hypothetical protein
MEATAAGREGGDASAILETEEGGLSSANDASSVASEGGPIADEPLYTPGARLRPKGAVGASNDDEMIAKWNRGGLGGVEGEPGPTGKVPHPAARIKVDVIKVSGHIKEADVLRTARSKGYWPFRLCYEEGLRRVQKLHGTVRLRITVGSGGAARGVQKVAAELDDPTVVSCVLKAARGLVLVPPERGAPQVTLEISLWPGDDPMQAPTAPAARSTLPRDSSALVAALRARWSDVRVCYREGLQRHEGLWGRLALRLRIRAAGEIIDASEVESHFPDSQVTDCVRRAFTHADAPPGAQELIIVYPLRLGTPPEPRDAGP